jgi:hypothetical protein
MLFEGYYMEDRVLEFDTCAPKSESVLVQKWKNQNHEQVADRILYKMKSDAGDLYLDSKWWELPDQQDVEVSLAEYARLLNSMGASCPVNKVTEYSRQPLYVYATVVWLMLVIRVANTFKCCGRRIFE